MNQPIVPSGVTLRALGIAVALVPINAYWLVQTEVIWWTGFPTTISLFSNVTFIVLLLALFGHLVRSRWPGAVLAPGELLTVYVFLGFTSVLCSVDFFDVLIPVIAFPQWSASPENRWNEIFFGTPDKPGPVPTWLVVTDQDALRGFFEGHSSLYRWSIIRAWIGPLFWWSTFVLALLLAVTMITLLFRQQWTEKERLSYPVIQIPLEIATNLPRLLRNRLFWTGFGVAGGIDILNGLHHLHPIIPGIPLIMFFKFSDHALTPPWDALGWTSLSIYMFAIGMCFFLPTDLIFSCWFFYLFYKAERILARMSGVHGMPGFPFTVQQSAGAYIGLCLLALWISRHHLRALVRTLLGQPGGLPEANEPLPYRTTAFLLLICTVYLVGFGVAAGASLWIMCLFFAIFFAFSIAIARMRAELGPPAHDLHYCGPDQLLNQALGTHGAGGANLAVFALFYSFNRAYRSHPAPVALESWKIAERLTLPPRRFLFAMVSAVVLGTVFSFWAYLHCMYSHGMPGTSGQVMGAEPWEQLASLLQDPKPANLPAMAALALGFLFSLFLACMRLAFVWWPFHPVGYAVSSTWSMDHLWFSMFLTWLLKSLLLRYGGARVYRPAVPLFIGLVLGEYVVGSLWTIYGVIYGVPVYRFWG